MLVPRYQRALLRTIVPRVLIPAILESLNFILSSSVLRVSSLFFTLLKTDTTGTLFPSGGLNNFLKKTLPSRGGTLLPSLCIEVEPILVPKSDSLCFLRLG